MSNHTNPNNCTMPDWYWTASDTMSLITYKYFTPIYVLFGLAGESVCLSMCMKEWKKDGAYLYQIFLTLCHMLEIITGGISYAGSGLYGQIGAEKKDSASVWYRSLYINIWYFAYFASPAVNSMITTTLLFSVCICADRSLAMARPFAYRHYNHKLRQIACFLFSLAIGIGTSVFDVFRRTVIHTQTGYYAIFDQEYTSRSYVMILSHVRNMTRVIALITLILINIALIYFYKRRQSQIAAMMDDKNSHAKKKEINKTLLMLTTYQSVSTTISVSFLVNYYILFYCLPGFSTCGIFLMAPVTDFAVAFVYTFDFYFILMMSHRFRRLMCACFYTGRTKVVPISGLGMKNAVLQ